MRTISVPTGSIDWGCAISAGVTAADLDAFEALAGKRISLLGVGGTWYSGGNFGAGSYTPFPSSKATLIHNRGGVLLYDWIPGNSFVAKLDDPRFNLRSIYQDHTHDGYITSVANAIKALGFPILLRVFHEMNGDWYQSYNEAGPNNLGNGGGELALAWRYLWTMFSALGVSNVDWVFNPNNQSSNSTSSTYRALSQFYPGDAYVDWKGIDAYNFGSPWISLQQALEGGTGTGLQNTYQNLVDLGGNPSMPILIPETGCNDKRSGVVDGSSKAAWFTSAFAYLPTRPLIKGVIYSQYNEGGDNWRIDYPLTGSGAGTTVPAFASAIANAYYLSSTLVTSSAARQLWGAWPRYGSSNYTGYGPVAGSALDVFETNVGKLVSVAHWGTQWLYGDRWQPFSSLQPGLQTLWDRGSIVMVDWGSWDLTNAANNHLLSMANIVAGAQVFWGVTIDVFLHQFFRDAAAYGHPLFIRMWHEMNANGGWGDNNFPWCLGTVSAGGFSWTNTPTQWKAAWAKVVGIARAEGAWNVTFVWCPNSLGTSGKTSVYTLASIYPGSAFVDWLALDAYGPPSFTRMLRGGTGTGLQDSYALLHALDTTKPICIAETGYPSGAARAAWIADALAVSSNTSLFPNLGMINWFWWTQFDTTLDGDGTNTTNPDLAAFRSGIASATYVAAGFGGRSPALHTPLQAYRTLAAPLSL